MPTKLDELYLEGDHFVVRDLYRSDLNKTYLGWLNDIEITQHLGWEEGIYSMEKLVSYYEGQSESTYQIFAIIDKEKDKHIGNLTFNPINIRHNHTGLGGIIGDKDYWGKSGAFVEGMRLLIEYGFKVRKFKKIYSGVTVLNVPCIIASKKTGFIEEGYLKEHHLYPDGKYVDAIAFGQINPYLD